MPEMSWLLQNKQTKLVIWGRKKKSYYLVTIPNAHNKAMQLIASRYTIGFHCKWKTYKFFT